MTEATNYLATENDTNSENLGSITTSTAYPPCDDLSVFEERELEYENEENVVIYGTEKQQEEMFKDWSLYLGEIQNPANTAVNTYFKSASGGMASYAPLDEVLKAARPILSKHGFGIFQSPTYKDNKVSVKTILTHKSGASISFPSLTVPIAKQDAQGIIAGITYARRGVLNPILGTHGEVDDDGNSCVTESNKKGVQDKHKHDDPPVKTVSQDILSKRKEVIDLANNLINKGVDRTIVNATLQKTCNAANPNSVNDIALLNTAVKALNEIKISN